MIVSTKPVTSAAAAAAFAALLLIAPTPLHVLASATPDDTGTSADGNDENKDDENNDGGPGTPNLPDSNNNSQSSGPGRLDGTYRHDVVYHTAHESATLRYSSSCAGCNVNLSVSGGSGTLIWTGGNWVLTTPGSCGPVTSTVTPTSNVGGYVRTATTNTVGMCGQDIPSVGNLTRVGP